MPNFPSYAILGRGLWAGKMRSVLEKENRRVTCIPNTRRGASETVENYIACLAAALRGSAEIAWLCVPPGPHVVWMIRAAIEAGVCVVIEKPWLVSASETRVLADLAKRRQLLLGVHFEYCLLDEMQSWQERFKGGDGRRFGGRFTLSKPDRLEIPAILNLGCHLLAMRKHAVPNAEIGEIACAYNSHDERLVWLEASGQTIDSIDFTQNYQPIIQRFIRRFEGGMGGAEFPFGAEFAAQVAEDLAKLPALQTEAFHRR